MLAVNPTCAWNRVDEVLVSELIYTTNPFDLVLTSACCLSMRYDS